MTSQQDTELEKILIRYRSTADAAWSEVKDGFYTQEEYEVALRKISDEAIQALTSWKDKEVKRETLKARLDTEKQFIKETSNNRGKNHKVTYCYKITCPVCSEKKEYVEVYANQSLQSQGGK